MSRDEHHRKKSHVAKKGTKKKVPSKTPAKPKKTNYSSDDSNDSYGGVDLISDTSDQYESDVPLPAEVSFILGGSVQVQDSDDSSDDDDQIGLQNFELPDDLGYLDEDAGFFEENLLPSLDPERVLGGQWPSEDIINTHGQAHEQIHSPSSNDSDTEQEDSFDQDLVNAGDPNIWWDVDALHPEFYRAIGHDDGASSDASSCWDLEEERGQRHLLEDQDVNEEDDSDGSSSGYETDIGETTDEDEDLETRCIPPERSVLRPNFSDAEEEVPPASRRAPRGPRLGTFVEDGEKSYATVDKDGNLTMWRSQRPVSVGQEFLHMPHMTNSANVMVSAALSQLNNGFDHQPFGLPEAFFPMPALGPASSSSCGEDEDEEGDSGSAFNMEDMIDYGDYSSDEDVENKGGEDAEPPSSTPARGGEERGTVLAHLKGDLVGAFKNHQNQHHLLTHGAATRDSLEFGDRVIRGIKGGRLREANTPITPLRKKNLAPSSPGSPLSRAATQKRKASESAEHNYGHKRNRSNVSTTNR